MNTPTEKMLKRGSHVCNLLMDANISYCMDGLGGSKTWDNFLEVNQNDPDIDLVVEYAIGCGPDGRHDAIFYIYLAMERERVANETN